VALLPSVALVLPMAVTPHTMFSMGTQLERRQWQMASSTESVGMCCCVQLRKRNVFITGGWHMTMATNSMSQVQCNEPFSKAAEFSYFGAQAPSFGS
jgi:hypothetical protein